MQTSKHIMYDFLRISITGNLKEIPYLDDESILLLNNNGITTSFQLFAKFLSFKTINTDINEHVHEFGGWLNNVLLYKNNNVRIIVNCISEKMYIIYPSLGSYDECTSNDEGCEMEIYLPEEYSSNMG